ncbi:MAG: hypothetical protein M5U09_27525 [Gammaproteobacteria bacterium]|nr:hypothetical protein [Gammaproteobacteria bacterium]
MADEARHRLAVEMHVAVKEQQVGEIGKRVKLRYDRVARAGDQAFLVHGHQREAHPGSMEAEQGMHVIHVHRARIGRRADQQVRLRHVESPVASH